MNQPRLVGGRYQLLDQLGRGGMGIVWRARDTTIGREVAIKQVLPPQGMGAHEAAALRERTLREARSAAQIRHPAVVAMHDVVEEGGEPWIVMELIRGRSLDQVVKAGGPMSPQWAASVGLFVLSALASAHARGILHRDVKPGNVLLADDGRILLSDFGIAAPSGVQAQPGAAPVGTAGYTAPECLAEPMMPGPHSDLFALGATLSFAVEGVAPFQRSTAMATLGAVMTEPPALSPRAGALGLILQGMLAKDPALRPDVPTLREALRKVTGNPADRKPAAEWRVSKPLAYGSAAGVVVAFVAALVLVFTVGSSAATPKPSPSPSQVAEPQKSASQAPSASASASPSTAPTAQPTAGPPGKFAKMPRPCSLLSREQGNALVGPYHTSAVDPSFQCAWANNLDGPKELAAFTSFVLYAPQGDGYEVTLATEHAAGRKKEMQEQAGRGGSGGKKGEVFDIPGAGDEAFGQEELETTVSGKRYVVNVTFRSSNMIGEIRFVHEDVASDPKLRDRAAEAAKFLVQGLASKAS
ncbi:MAG: serine/threonine protein kinase [Nonomuraea sp.]|nr:serine/threonine protein kinase [Nonomuraea sp.]